MALTLCCKPAPKTLRWSVPPQPGRCIAEPFTEVAAIAITFFFRTKIQIGEEAIQSFGRCLLKLHPSGATDPAIHRAVSLGEFIDVDPILKTHGLALCHTSKDVLNPEACCGGEHEAADFHQS